MKIKQKKSTVEQVLSLPKAKAFPPPKPSFLIATAIRVASAFELKKTSFSWTKENAEVLKKQPCFILMNHSSFIDLKMASKILYPKKFNIICTADGFVGKKWLMKSIGCIPTKKFVSDFALIKDINKALAMGNHVLMYPEASYSFDGTQTMLPKRMGALLKMLGVPVVTIITKGAFSHDPLYNGLQPRKVKTSAHVKCLFTKEQTQELSIEALSEGLERDFTFDGFKWQQENKIKISEPFRADGLHRVLYKCPHCKTEGQTEGKGIYLTCHACGKKYLLDEYGYMVAIDGDTEFSHIPDWTKWQRACVKQEILDGKYFLDTQVDIGVQVDYKAIYMIGGGRLIHNENGFVLQSDDEKLKYEQPPLFSYSVYSDYYWYEIADVICIGDKDRLYYCFPKQKGVVTKTRFAVEELYKIKKGNK